MAGWRRSGPLAVGLVVMMAGVALGAVSWLDPTVEHPRVGKQYTWNYGSSLGMTDDGKLHTAWATDFVKGSWASDGGPYQGVYYLHGTVGPGDAVSWSKPKRISPGKKHAERSAATAEGDHVYVGYVTQKNYDAYDPSQPRVFYVRVNTNNGAGAAWQSAKRLSPGRGRVDYPVLAAAGNNVYAIWTNSKSGAMVFARSTDNGATWATSKVGAVDHKDTDDPNEGYGGWPGVCADGNRVGVAWLDDPNGPGTAGDGAVVARVSTDGGATFGGAVTLEGQDGHLDSSWPQCAAHAASGKVVFTWTNHTSVKASVFTTKMAHTDYTVIDFADLGNYNGGYGPVPEFSPSGSEVGIAITACKDTRLANDCNYYNNKARSETFWTEGAPGSWPAPTKIAAVSRKRAKAFLNDYASVVWYDADTRFVTYNTWNANYFRYQVHLQTGMGT